MEIVEYPVENEYEKRSQMRDAILQLKSWLREQPHLPGALLTELDLILVYHSCSHDIDAAKILLDRHYALRTQMPFFNLLLDDKLEKAMHDALITMLPTPAPDGTTILYCRVLTPVPSSTSLVEYLRMLLMSMDIWQHEHGTWPGVTFVVDLKNISLGYILRIDLVTLRQFLSNLQESLLAELKTIHLVNAPKFVDKLLMIIKPLMKQSLTQLLNVHQDSDVDSLPKVSDLDLDALRDAAIDKIKSNQEFFKSQSKKVVMESKRLGKNKNK